MRYENYRTPAKRARGLGSAQAGVEHWWGQRVSALALVPLTVWFVISLLSTVGGTYTTAVAWLSQPVNAVLMSIFMAALFYHSWLGVQVVIEDYIHTDWLKLTALLLSQFIHAVLMAGAIFVILRLAYNA